MSCEHELAPDARRAVGLGLAGFLRCLHSAEHVEDVLAAGPAGRKPDLAVDPNARPDMSQRVPMARTQLEAVRKASLWDPPEEGASILAAAEALPPLRRHRRS